MKTSILKEDKYKPDDFQFISYSHLKAFSATCFVILLFSLQTIAQTNIGGIINTYVKVTAIGYNCSCPSNNCATITVTSSTGFAANDRVLLIQMKGARADSTNTSAFGSVLNLFDAGNYEFATIASIAGNVITTVNPIKQTYFTSTTPSDSACVQLIKVPVYAGNVNVTSTLTSQAFNGTTGGVLALEVEGTLTLQANVSVSGLGFHGAKRLQSVVACTDDTAFYYQSSIWNYASCTSCGYVYNDASVRRVGVVSYGGCGATCFTNRLSSQDNRVGAYKGEGIVAFTFKKTFANGNVAVFEKGKGRWGNGGGGGGNHNAGGGGGANYGAGGWGGSAYNTSACTAGTLSARRGCGGTGLTPTASKIFMGGGGGEGHDNGLNGSTGVAGGGIIFIAATSIVNSGAYTISADGANNAVIAFGDGSGGGGAGGSILLNVSGSFTNAITISAKGGKGGDHNNNTCHGTGGGGGSGVIWFSQSSLPANVTTNVIGGANGIQIAPTFDCSPDANWGATSGGAGVVMYGLASGATTFFNTCSCASLLPIELVSFAATAGKENVQLDWVTASEINNDYFVIEKSPDGLHFSELAKIDGAGISTQLITYSIEDKNPYTGKNYYRLVQTDFDGTINYSQIEEVNFEIIDPQITVYPNPAKTILKMEAPELDNFDLSIIDVNGKWIAERKNISGMVQIGCEDFPNGIYLLKINAGHKNYYQKIMVDH